MDEPSAGDEELLADLRDAGRLDPVPPEAVAAVRAAFMWRTIDAELAELTYDSSVDDELLATVRHAGASRFLTFETPALTLELEASGAGERRSLTGQLVPPQPGSVEVRHRAGSVAVEADELGRFRVDDVPPGPVRLVCRTGPDTLVSTDWVLV